MKLKYKRIDPRATEIKYGSAGAACFDLSSVEDAALTSGEFHAFGTGLAFEVPEGYVMLLFSRSGMGFKNQVRLCNCVGVIDSDYRGEVKVGLVNDSCRTVVVNRGDRIAQAMLLPVQQVQFEQAVELAETERGEGGFGSTGK